MTYKELLVAVAQYGRGVFSVNMLPDLKGQNALKQFVLRNPSLFKSFAGRNGDLVIRSLTKEGYKYLEISARPSQAENWYSYLDMLLLNSYMFETGKWVKYSIKPPIVAEIGGKKVGLLSLRWGFSLPAEELDIILAAPYYHDRIIRNNSQQNSSILSDNLMQKIYTPKALQSLRKTVL